MSDLPPELHEALRKALNHVLTREEAIGAIDPNAHGGLFHALEAALGPVLAQAVGKSGLQIETSRVVVIRGFGTDRISFYSEACPTPYPELDQQDPGCYPAYFQVECRKGYAEEWLSQMGFESGTYELIETQT